jgi:hypothetical protein
MISTQRSNCRCLRSESQPKVKHFMGQVFGATSQNGDRARAGTRAVSDYGPGARRGQPGEVPGLPDQRGRRGESVRNMNVPVFSLDLHFEPLVFRRFGRRQERRQCSALKIISARRWRGHAGEGPWARVPKFCLSENAYNLGKCRTLARSVPTSCESCLFCQFSRRGAKPLCLVPFGARWRLYCVGG